MADHLHRNRCGHFPRRQLRRYGGAWRLNHDAWIWLFVAALLGWLVVMELLR